MQARSVFGLCHSLSGCHSLEPVSHRGQRTACSNGKRNRTVELSFTKNITPLCTRHTGKPRPQVSRVCAAPLPEHPQFTVTGIWIEKKKHQKQWWKFSCWQQCSEIYFFSLFEALEAPHGAGTHLRKCLSPSVTGKKKSWTSVCEKECNSSTHTNTHTHTSANRKICMTLIKCMNSVSFFSSFFFFFQTHLHWFVWWWSYPEPQKIKVHVQRFLSKTC